MREIVAISYIRLAYTSIFGLCFMSICLMKSNCYSLTLQMAGGRFCVFGTFLWSNWPKKIWLFLNIYDNASHTLSEAQNGLKKDQNLNLEMCFLAFFEAKMTKSEIQNPKKIIIDSFGHILSNFYHFFKFLMWNMSFCLSS